MATITKRIEVCDVCRDVSRPIAHRFRVSVDSGRLRAWSLCEGDGLPLVQALAALATTAKDAPAHRPNRQVTLSQIEAVKTQATPVVFTSDY